MSSASEVHDPFLFRFATPRSAGLDIAGHYSSEQDVWVVERDGLERPIVEIASGSLTATQTKTMTQQEVDDDDFGRGCNIELVTNTAIVQERDDEDAMLQLLELRTKTEVQHERDDESKPVL